MNAQAPTSPRRLRRLALGITIAVVMMVWFPLAVAWIPHLAAPTPSALVASGGATTGGRQLVTSASGAVIQSAGGGSTRLVSAAAAPVTRTS